MDQQIEQVIRAKLAGGPMMSDKLSLELAGTALPGGGPITVPNANRVLRAMYQAGTVVAVDRVKIALASHLLGPDAGQ